MGAVAAGRGRSDRCRRGVGGDRRLPGDRVELDRDVARRVPSPLRVLRQAPLHDPVESLRRDRPLARDRLRLGAHDGGGEARRGGAAEGTLAGRHLVEDAAQGPDVGPRVRGLAFELLRSHVRHGADERAFLGDRRPRTSPPACRPPAREVSRLAPGRSPGPWRRVARQDHVAGLEVAMNDAAPMSRLDRLGDLAPDLQNLRDRQRTLSSGGSPRSPRGGTP